MEGHTKGHTNEMSLQRIGKDFERALREIQSKRMAGPDMGLPRPTSCERLTDAIVKEPEWKSIETKLIQAQRKEKVFGGRDL